MQQDLGLLGIRVEIIERDAPSVRATVRNGEADLYLGDWYADYPDPENFSYPLFHSSNRGPGGNYAFLSDTALDAMIERARSTPDTLEKARLSREIDARVFELVPWIFLWFPADVWAVQPDVKGWRIPAVFTGQRWTSVERTGVEHPAWRGLRDALPADPAGPAGAHAAGRPRRHLPHALRRARRSGAGDGRRAGRRRDHRAAPGRAAPGRPAAAAVRPLRRRRRPGDLGTSYITRRPILADLLQRFPATLELAGAAMLFAARHGHRDRHLRRVAAREAGPTGSSTFGAYLGVSFPVYWVGLLLIMVFAVTFRWLPPSGARGPLYIILPALTLGMRSVAFLSRMTRAAMQEMLRSDFVRTARAKGLGEGRVVLRHAFRNALLPVLTVLGLDFGSYLTGSILTETIFSWPGVGRYVLTAIDKRDLPGVQGSILFLSLVFVLVNLLTDVLYARVDPRVAYD